MLDFLNQLLETSSTDPDERRQARFLNILLVGIASLTFIVLMASFIVSNLDQTERRFLWASTGATLVSIAIIFILNRYWSHWVSSWAFLIFLVLVVAFSDTPEEVINGRTLFVFTIPILIASVILSPKSSFIVAALASVVIGIIGVQSLGDLNMIAVTSLFAVALVAWLAARSLEQALADLRATNQELENRSTELEEANALLRQENIERQRAEAELAEQAWILTRTNAELQQFAYVSTHDLREPLRKVRSYAELLERRYQGQLDAKADKYIHYIVAGATRMQTLITDLLAYLNVGSQELAFQTADLNQVLSKVLLDLEILIEETSAAITHDPLPTLTVDPSQISHLLQNLVSNALKFRRDERPVVHIGAKCQNSEWIFSVTDNGIGIEEQYAERIFVIFQRLHTKEVYPGTGIGLAICKKVVENHNGCIWLTSQPDHGTTFYFTLPV